MPSRDLETLALEKVKNRYLLTLLISKRVNQLKGGAKPLIEEDCHLTLCNIALREIVAGKITPQRPSPPEPPPTISTETDAQPDSVEQNESPA